MVGQGVFAFVRGRVHSRGVMVVAMTIVGGKDQDPASFVASKLLFAYRRRRGA
jgi:hypothetical protein